MRASRLSIQSCDCYELDRRPRHSSRLRFRLEHALRFGDASLNHRGSQMYRRRWFFLRVDIDVNDRQTTASFGRLGLRHDWLSRRLLVLDGGGDYTWANRATVLCPHLDGSKKNSDDK